MKNTYRWKIILIVFPFVLLIITMCKKNNDENKPVITEGKPTPYNLKIPSHFPPMEKSVENPLTVEGVSLGRKLYYDPILSNDGQRSCSSCHFQENGFTTKGTNIISHVNLGWSHAFLWNGKKEGNLENIMLFEVEDFMKTDLTKLQNHAEYPDLFNKAFGTKEITSKYAAYALAQFFRTMISGNSRFDKYYRGELQLNPKERNGMAIFFTEKGDCFHCHGSILFTDNDFHNIGLESTFSGENTGRAAITNNMNDLGKFKTPTLRNVALRQGYMHDARFKTLEEVVEHYNSGVKRSSTLDPIMTKAGKQNGLNLTDKEKSELVAFLNTLTDSSYITNPKLSKP